MGVGRSVILPYMENTTDRKKQLERHALGMVYGRNLAHDANNYRETRFTHNK